MVKVPLVSDEAASEEVRRVFDEIRAARGGDYVANFWRALANDPSHLRALWDRVCEVMIEERAGGLGALEKEMVYLAVAVSRGCTYCIHEHSAAARALGMSEAQFSDLLDVVAVASQTSETAQSLGVEVDARFLARDDAGD